MTRTSDLVFLHPLRATWETTGWRHSAHASHLPLPLVARASRLSSEQLRRPGSGCHLQTFVAAITVALPAAVRRRHRGQGRVRHKLRTARTAVAEVGQDELLALEEPALEPPPIEPETILASQEEEEEKEDKWKPYPQHLRAKVVQQGLKKGKFLVGELQRLKKTTDKCQVLVDRESFFVPNHMAMNRALDGDIVAIKRKEYSSKRKEDKTKGSRKLAECEVVHIVERKRRLLAGTIQSSKTAEFLSLELKEGERLFFPADESFPYVIVRPTPDQPPDDEIEGLRVIVSIDVWDRFSPYPRGHWTRTLGKIGDVDAETEMILMEHSVITDEFSEEVMKCLPPADFTPSEEDLRDREDFRKVCVCSIDPEGCEDVDDALSCEVLENGNFRVGVHIADVSHFLKGGSDLDIAAGERCESVYLVDRRIDMLPRLLTTDICSLRCDGKDRLAFSSIFEITPEAEIVSQRFTKSVIRSTAALAYHEAQAILDGEDGENQEVTTSVRNLNGLAVQLRERRLESGALTMDSDEIRFDLDPETKLPTELTLKEPKPANSLIEEFMLLANQAAARTISKFNDLAVLRRHPRPKEEGLEDLKALVELHGITDFKYGSNKELAQSLNKCKKRDDPFFEQFIRTQAVKCFNLAEYFCICEFAEKKWYHYGLAMTHYTHFTSPIRRYADCLVHRFLNAYLELESLHPTLQDEKMLVKQAMKMNVKHKNQQEAGRESANLYLFLYFRAKGAVEALGLVSRVFKKGAISVAVAEYGTEGMVELDPNDWTIIDEEQKAFGRPLSEYEGMKIGLFNWVRVRIEADNTDGRFRNLKMTFVDTISEEELRLKNAAHSLSMG